MPRLLQDTLITTAERYPDYTALVAGDVRMNYREVIDYACRLAHALRSLGISRGDRVAIFMDNSRQCALSVYGILLAGGVFVAISAQTKRDKLAFILNDSGSRVLLSEPNLARVFAPLARQMPALKILCTANAKALPAGVENTDEILADMPVTPPPQPAITLDLAALIYTSGTTGVPKGVMHTHRSLLFVLNSINEYLSFSANDRLFSALPLNFGYGLFQWLSAVHAGATLVQERSFIFPAQVFKRMHDEAVTSFAGVPTVFAMMLAHDAKQALRFPSVRIVTNAAAALPADFIPGIRRIFPEAGLYKMYGQTECIRCAYLDPALAELKPESVGSAIPGTELLLLNKDGHTVAQGEIGNLHIRGPHIMQGYWNLPEKTAEVLVPGPLPGEFLLKSGDLFRQDADGDLCFVARSDEIIKSRGEKVSPAEVENAIYSLPAVQEVVVAGVPDPLLGEAVCAFVAVREGESLSVQQIKHICNERLENYMVPKHVLLLPKLPHTASGKLSRKLTIEQHAASLAKLK
ncbi:class I adenylate-forming enzyme family protein [Candidatus Methylobacter oryzae]|uniref:Acyl--CoA ligase n=1 Tax=Candidatus Methylobacter oryzae TaxID=2497749 RepID=A0ABY3C859_9GAMM|nr:class I adenylate-forming enzyme family protein [Candidatus Methylobacter oryzae]TRW92067.1 acyl--CoA ligase [Candidatus Methylobacter oryzae]